MIIVGGMGSIPGAVLGGFLLGLVEVMSVALTGQSSYRDAIAFAALFLILLVRPSGMLGRAPRAKPEDARMEDLLATYASLINFLGRQRPAGAVDLRHAGVRPTELGNAAFMGIGAYTAALLGMRAGWPFAGEPGRGLVLGVLAAFVLGLPVLRLRGVFLAIATIGFGEIVRIVALNATPLTGGALGLNGIPPRPQTWHIYLALLLALYPVLADPRQSARLRLAGDPRGRDRGAHDGHQHHAVQVGGARCSAADSRRSAGGLAAHFTFFIGPNEYGFASAVNILIYAIVGGTGVFWGRCWAAR